MHTHTHAHTHMHTHTCTPTHAHTHMHTHTCTHTHMYAPLGNAALLSRGIPLCHHGNTQVETRSLALQSCPGRAVGSEQTTDNCNWHHHTSLFPRQSTISSVGAITTKDPGTRLASYRQPDYSHDVKTVLRTVIRMHVHTYTCTCILTYI